MLQEFQVFRQVDLFYKFIPHATLFPGTLNSDPRDHLFIYKWNWNWYVTFGRWNNDDLSPFKASS